MRTVKLSLIAVIFIFGYRAAAQTLGEDNSAENNPNESENYTLTNPEIAVQAPCPYPVGDKKVGFFVFGGAGNKTATWIRDEFMPYIHEGDFILANSGADINGPNPPPWSEAEIDGYVNFVKSLPIKMRLVIRTTGLPNTEGICSRYKTKTAWHGWIVAVSPTYENGQQGPHFIDPRCSHDSRCAQAWDFAIEQHKAFRAATDDAGLEHWGFAGGNLVLSSNATGGGLPYGHMAKTCHVSMLQMQGAVKGGQYPERWIKYKELLKAANVTLRELMPQNCTVGTSLLNALPGQDAPWVNQPWADSRQRIVDATNYFYTEPTHGYKANGYIVQYQIDNDINISRTIDMMKALGRTTSNIPTITQNGGTLSTLAGFTYQWYINGVVITGATKQTYSPTKSGSYTVKVTDANGCSATSKPFNFTTTGLNNNLAEQGIQIYPNPTTGKFIWEGKFNTTAQIDIINIIGEKIFSKLVEQNENIQRVELDITEFPSGIYLMQLRSEKQFAQQKIIKE